MITTTIHLSDILNSQRIDVAYYKDNSGTNNFVSLSKYVDIKGGKRIPKDKSFSFENTNYLYLRLSDITDFECINYSVLKNISEELFNILKRYEICNNEIVFSIAGTIGRVFVVKNIPEGKRVILTENCAKLLPKNDGVLPEYISILLNCDFIQKQIEKNRIQTTIPKIGLERIGKIRIPILPDIKRQTEIIDFYEKELERQRQMIQLANIKENNIDSVILSSLGMPIHPNENLRNNRNFCVNISELLNNRIDPYYHKRYFKEAFDSLKKADGIKCLKDIAVLITSGITPKSGGKDYTTPDKGIAFIRSGDIDINGDINYSDLLYITQEIHDTQMKSSQLKRNDIMIAIVGATIGQVGIYLSDNEANINQAIALVRLKENINPEYVKEVLNSSIGQLNLDRLKRPVARANINLEEIASIMIPVPDIDKQNEIVRIVKGIRKKIKQCHLEGNSILNEARQKIEKLILE